MELICGSAYVMLKNAVDFRHQHKNVLTLTLLVANLANTK